MQLCIIKNLDRSYVNSNAKNMAIEYKLLAQNEYPSMLFSRLLTWLYIFQHLKVTKSLTGMPEKIFTFLCFTKPFCSLNT